MWLGAHAVCKLPAWIIVSCSRTAWTFYVTVFCIHFARQAVRMLWHLRKNRAFLIYLCWDSVWLKVSTEFKAHDHHQFLLSSLHTCSRNLAMWKVQSNHTLGFLIRRNLLIVIARIIYSRSVQGKYSRCQVRSNFHEGVWENWKDLNEKLETSVR